MLYFGTLAIIGLSAPGNRYSQFVADYMNFVNPLRDSILFGAKNIMALTGHPAFLKDAYTLQMQTGEGIRMVYSCIGYGIMSFWAAFVFANHGSWQKKGRWIVSGLAALWAINVLRIAFLLLAITKHWPVSLGWDHHTWFNIVTYAIIFGMIYFYDRSARHISLKPDTAIH